MTDDDTKFERARRERPHIEAFAQTRHDPPATDTPPAPVTPRTWQQMREAWNTYDETHRPPVDRP